MAVYPSKIIDTASQFTSTEDALTTHDAADPSTVSLTSTWSAFLLQTLQKIKMPSFNQSQHCCPLELQLQADYSQDIRFHQIFHQFVPQLPQHLQTELL